jgi:hypothetical protein
MLRLILRRLLNPGIYAGVLLTALAVTLAYQVRPSYDIAVGEPVGRPYLAGFNTQEVSNPPGEAPVPFRWTTGYSIVTLPAVGRQDFAVTLNINGARPPDQAPARLRITSGATTLYDGSPEPGWRDYSFTVPREVVRDGTLVVELHTNAFLPNSDSRTLGVLVHRVQVSPGSNPDRFIEPPLGVLLSLVGTAALLGLFLALTGWGVGVVALGASIPALLGGWLLVADRLWLTAQEWPLEWALATVLGIMLALLVGTVGWWLMARGGATWKAWHGRALLAVVALAFVVRFLGQLHPQICIIDIYFHLHRFQTVEAGELLFTTASSEWGGRKTFYLPTAYLFMMPLNWVFKDPLFVIRLFTVGISTLGAVPLFYMASRILKDSRAGLIAATLYLGLPIAVIPFWWGITTNLFGEFFALCSLAIVIGAGEKLRPNRPAFWLLLVTLVLTLLSHPGVVLLTSLAITLIVVLRLVGKGRSRDRVSAGWTFSALVLAAGISYVLYYRHFVGDMLTTLEEIRKERASRTLLPEQGIGVLVGGSVVDKSLGLDIRYAQSRLDWLLGGLRGFWQEAQVYYRVWPLVGAFLGFWSARRLSVKGTEVHDASRSGLMRSVLGWALAVGSFALVGWVMNLYVRYSLFLLPVVALGTGVLLSRLWRRGWVGALLVTLVIAFFIFEAFAFWHQRINYSALCPNV